MVYLFELSVRNLVDWDILKLDILAGQAILAVAQLDKIIHRITNSAVVFHHHTLHSLDETSLDVSGFGCLDCRVDETFSATHCVEEKFRGREAYQIGIFDETFCLRRVVVFKT